MTQSMSRVGRCIDNGPIESFWGTLKCEKYYLHKYNSYEELKLAIDDYIHFYYFHCLLDRVQFNICAWAFFILLTERPR